MAPQPPLGVPPRSLAFGMTVALLSTAAAMVLATGLRGAPVSFFMIAIMVSVWAGGLWPGVTAVVLSQIAFSLSLNGFSPSDPDQLGQIQRQLMFTAAGILVVAIGVAQRRSAASAASARDQVAASLQQVRDLWRRTITAQDDERRRVALLLHDSTGQDLLALKMLLNRLDRTGTILGDDDRRTIREAIDLSDQSISSLRTQSYLLYPPFLDDAGVTAALRWYATGFQERSGVTVTLDFPEHDGRLPERIESVLFRIAQEALSNIHRHSGGTGATVRLRRTSAEVILEIADQGQGMPAVLAESATAALGRQGAGVGLVSMREHLEQVDGRLTIDSSASGTTIRAAIPLSPD